MSQDNPFVLELEIDDEISFKPAPKKNRILQPLNENKLNNNNNNNKNNKNDIMKPFILQTNEVNNNNNNNNLVLITEKVKVEEKNNDLLLSSLINNETNNNNTSSNNTSSDNNNNDNNISENIESSSLISSEVNENKLLTKIEELEYQNQELIKEKNVIENRMNDLLSIPYSNTNSTSNSTDITSHPDIEVKSLREQLERANRSYHLLLTEHSLEIKNLKSSYEKRISEVITSNGKAIIDMQQRISNDISSKWEKKLNDEKAKVDELTTSLQVANTNLNSLQNNVEKIIYDTKKKIYEKVKTQFDSGNKEFHKLKMTMKDIVQEKEKYEKKCTQHESITLNLTNELTTLKENHSKLLKSVEEGNDFIQNICNKNNILTTTTNNNNNTSDSLNLFQNNLNVLEGIINEKNKEIDSLKEQKNQLETLLTQIQQNELKQITTERDEYMKSQIESIEQNKKLEDLNNSLKDELNSLKLERDSQMLVIAELLSNKNNNEEELIIRRKEVEELSLRCDGLRKMNEEVVSMLEKVYAQNLEPTEF